MIRIVLAVTNDVVTDNRIHKIAGTLQTNGYDVTVAGFLLKNSTPLAERLYKVKRFRLCFRKTALFYANYNIKLFFFLLRKRFDIIVANDIDTLAACWLAGIITKKVLVFDSHELFTGLPELENRPFIRKVWLMIERLIVPKIRFGYTVSSPIVEYYRKNYNKNLELIRNVGVYRQGPVFKGFVNNGENIVVYQGSVNVGRGIELMLNALKYLENIRFWVIGHGTVVDSLKKLACELSVSEKVVFLGRIELDKLWGYTENAHIGISLEEDLGLNYRYALPNKLFDYVQSRIPVIVSDLPEMKALVENYGVGLVLKQRTPEELANCIKLLVADREFHSALSQNLDNAAKELCWQNEEQKLLSIYQKACGQL
ncbi:MAG: glycosyltransferase [Bacteroidales bacterium]|nr:glycosyltransferase [Bacteroidales bacterium]